METATQTTHQAQEPQAASDAPHLRALLAARPDKELRALGEKHGVWETEQTREALVTALVGALRSQEASTPASNAQIETQKETQLGFQPSPLQEAETADAEKREATDKQEKEATKHEEKTAETPALIEDETDEDKETRTSGSAEKDEQNTKAEKAGLKELQAEMAAAEGVNHAPASAKKVKTPSKAPKRPMAASTTSRTRLQHKTKVTASSGSAVKTAVVKARSASARKPARAHEFSFARPTESSTSRCRASAEAHAKATLALRSTPSRKPAQPKAPSSRSAPGAKTTRSHEAKNNNATPKKMPSHFSYTPYTGPLPPYNVESSFAPKSAQQDRLATKSTPRSRPLGTPKKQNSRPTDAGSSGKENNGAEPTSEAEQASKKTPTSAARRVPVKKSADEPSASKENTRKAFQEKSKAQRALAQDAARSTASPSADVSAEMSS